MSQRPSTSGNRRPDLRRKAIPLVGVIFGMAALAWAAVPLYDMFCRVTGFGGTTQVSEQGSDRVLDKTVTVRFDASTVQDMPWEFRPAQARMKLRIGETGLAFYEAYNPTDRVIAGTASYNVAPFSVGGYFTKIDCFCFTEQVLQPGERVRMPVTFYVDPEIVEDSETKGVTTITLSYTFYETELDSQAALSQTATDPGVN
ncbi:MAG TPA: cytochrome c oxidase assembly protein [Thermohalobaculum sp.]|nr:cytochrome c oxidase assembly protein [Thermohalobaculum sp.]